MAWWLSNLVPSYADQTCYDRIVSWSWCRQPTHVDFKGRCHFGQFLFLYSVNFYYIIFVICFYYFYWFDIFYERAEKDDNKVILEDKDLEVIGTPSVQYDDTNVIIQHIESGLWLSYKTYQVRSSFFILHDYFFIFFLSCSPDPTIL